MDFTTALAALEPCSNMRSAFRYFGLGNIARPNPRGLGANGTRQLHTQALHQGPVPWLGPLTLGILRVDWESAPKRRSRPCGNIPYYI